MVKHWCRAQWIARVDDFLGIQARAGVANQRFIGCCARKITGPVLARLLNTQYLDRHSRRSFARRWAPPIINNFLPSDDADLRRRVGPSEPRRQSMLEKIKKQKLVVIGNGMAGIRTVEVLLDRAPDLYDITVFGSEPYGNYNRILLSPVLAGEKTVNDIMLNAVQCTRITASRCARAK
jgi:hypothetical protein